MSHDPREFLVPVLIQVLARLRRTFRALLLIHIACLALGTVLLVPLLGVLGRVLLGLSGHTVVADQDILYFLLSPFGLALALLAAAFIVALTAAELAAQMALGAANARGLTLGTVDALRFAARRFVRIARLALLLLLRFTLIALPFLAVIGAIYWLALTDHDINYYLSRRPAEFQLAAVAILIVVACMACLLLQRAARWSLALPCVLFAGLAPRAALRASAQLTRGRRGRILIAFALCAVAAAVIGTVVIGSVGLLGTWLASVLTDSLRPLVFVLGALVAVSLLLSVPLGALNAGGFATLVLALYESFAGPVQVAALQGARAPHTPKDAERSGRSVLVLAAAAAMAILLACGWLLRQARVTDQVVVIAHRGAAGAAPENTLASIRRAIDDGADWIEIDVQETVDDEVIVIHDADFMRLAGVPLKVWDGTLAQVRAIDVGSWFAPAFAGERVPTLREVLETARGRARVVIELKYYGHERHLEQRVVEIVESAGMAEDIVVMSLQQAGIDRLRAVRPDWTVGLLVAKAVGDLSRVQADFLAVNRGLARSRFISAAHRSGKKVYVWTVNDPATLSSMMSLGVDGVITDEPAMARRVLAERSSFGTAERLLLRTAVLLGRPVPARRYSDDSP